MQLTLLILSSQLVPAAALTADQIIDQVMESDTWGLADAEVKARAVLHDERGAAKRELAFGARSKRHTKLLSKSVIRFSAPADVKGVGFLQIQQASGDDERHLFLPELGRARRIAGANRNASFMGTDFSYADLDRRDLRQSKRKLLADETLGTYPCYHLDITPSGESSYGRIEMWIRKDNVVPLKMLMYSPSGALAKTLTVREIKRISNRWFITQSLMVNHEMKTSTEIMLDDVRPSTDFSDDEFTVRNLERL